MNNSIRLAAVLAGLAVCICLCLAACRKETPGGENTATDTAGVGSDMSDTPGGIDRSAGPGSEKSGHSRRRSFNEDLF